MADATDTRHPTGKEIAGEVEATLVAARDTPGQAQARDREQDEQGIAYEPRPLALGAQVVVEGGGQCHHGGSGRGRLVVSLLLDPEHHVVGGHAGASDNEQVARVQALIYSYLWDQLAEPAAE